MAIPNEAGWPLKTINEICSLVSRGTAPAYVEHSDVFAIGQRCVTTSRFAPEFARPHSDRAMRNVLCAGAGDVLLNSTGTGTIGRSAVFDAPGTFIVDGHVTVLRPKADVADGRWLNAVLRTSWAQNHLERFCYSGSTNQVELGRASLAASALPIPESDEQVTIVRVMDALDTAIRETEAIIGKLKAVEQGLLHDLLTRGIDANGELRPPQSEAPHLYKQFLVGWIPNEWNATGLASVAPRDRSVIRTGPFGSSLKGEHWREFGRPVVTIGSLGEGKFLENELLYIEETTANLLSDFALVPGDIVFSRVADVGRSIVITERERGWIMSSNFMRISVDPERVRPKYLQMLLASSIAVRSQIRATVNSSGRDVANSKVLLELNFPWPDIDEQDRIIEATFLIIDRLSEEDLQLRKLQTVKDGLMDDLLTGRVRVTPLLKRADDPLLAGGK